MRPRAAAPDYLLALVRIAQRLENVLGYVTTCSGCGCLVRDLERCPGCQVRRRDERGSAAVSALLILACWVAVVGFGLMLLAGWSDWWPEAPVTR